ncbi:MAG: alginate export family protein [Cytophagales bacterium]
MKKPLHFKITVGVLLSIFTQIACFAQFVPNQPVFQLPGIPLWTIGAQVRPRAEFRQGLGDPKLTSENSAAGFISQRTNLNLGFRFDKFNFLMDFRDVRVWGQDASTINNADGNRLFLHQGWGEFTLATTADTNCKLKIDNLSLKVGRQEIVYEDSRLFGNLDWLQQGRRHDAVVLKFLHKGYQVDLGGAFNQNTDAFNKTNNTYSSVNTSGFGTSSSGALVPLPANFVQTNDAGGNMPVVAGAGPTTNALNNHYKTLAFLVASRKFNQTKITLMGINDNFQRYTVQTIPGGVSRGSAGGDTTNLGTLIGRSYNTNALNHRFTIGGQFSTQIGNASENGKILLNGGAYGQFGHNPAGRFINAYHAFFYGTYTIGKWTFGPGYDILSGNTTNVTGSGATAAGSGDNRFDPLYGTPHRWWGYMDYFYVGTGSPRSGLQDFYFRLRHDRKNFWVTLDVHHFMTAGKDVNWRATATTSTTTTDPISGAVTTNTVQNPFEKLESTYGQELDLVANYQINKFVNLEAGYSVFLATPTLAASKGLAGGKDGYDRFNQWAYLQLNFRPEFLYQKPVAIKN